MGLNSNKIYHLLSMAITITILIIIIIILTVIIAIVELRINKDKIIKVMMIEVLILMAVDC